MNERVKHAAPVPASDHPPALTGAWLGLAIVPLVTRGRVLQQVPPDHAARPLHLAWLRFPEELLARVTGER